MQNKRADQIKPTDLNCSSFKRHTHTHTHSFFLSFHFNKSFEGRNSAHTSPQIKHQKYNNSSSRYYI